MRENDVNPPINNDPMEKRKEFIDHPSYLSIYLSIYICPATPPREDFVQLCAPEKEKCDRRKLKWF